MMTMLMIMTATSTIRAMLMMMTVPTFLSMSMMMTVSAVLTMPVMIAVAAFLSMPVMVSMATMLTMPVMVAVAALFCLLVMVLMGMAVLFPDFFQKFFHPVVFLLHGPQYLHPFQLLPGCRDDDRFRIVFSYDRHSIFCLFFTDTACPAQDNQTGVFDLIQEKFPEIFRVHFTFGRIHYYHRTA